MVAPNNNDETFKPMDVANSVDVILLKPEPPRRPQASNCQQAYNKLPSPRLVRALTAGGILFLMFVILLHHSKQTTTLQQPVNSGTTTTFLDPTFFDPCSVQIAYPHYAGFIFMHISKCAGASWIKLLKNLLPSFYPKSPQGMELSYSASIQYNENFQVLFALKSPRKHIWSLFTELKYDDKLHHYTIGTPFPNAGNGVHRDDGPYSNDTDLDDIQHWMGIFLDDDENGVPIIPPNNFGPMHPANFQSRFLTTTRYNPWSVKDEEWVYDALLLDIGHNYTLELSDEVDPTVPPLDEALQRLHDRRTGWVGIVEFFHESQCLLFWQYTRFHKHKDMSTYLDDHCHCRDEDSHDAMDEEEVHVQHHSESHRDYVYDLPQEILRSMDKLTETDQALYRIALMEFLQRVVMMEADLNRQVLCSIDEEMELELAYIWEETPVESLSTLIHHLRENEANRG